MLTFRNLIKIRDNAFIMLGAVLVRQVLLIAAGLLIPWARAHGLLELVAVLLLIIIVVGWGQWRSWKTNGE